MYFSHDTFARLTSDGAAGTTISYNYLDLPQKVMSGSGTLVNYSYLADGSKREAVNGSGAGLAYKGSLIYRKASGGTLTLEGANVPEGRLLPGGETFRYHFTGKEDQGVEFTAPYTDFGARHYAPTLRRWLVPDPMSEKYYGISPYAYCAGDPVNCVDYRGMDIYRFDNQSGIVELFKETDDDFDQIGDFKRNKKGDYVLKGSGRFLIDNIPKGILKDQMNFKSESNVINIFENGIKKEQFDRFIVEFSDLIGKEIGGTYYSEAGDGIISHIGIGPYKKNRSHETNDHGSLGIANFFGRDYSAKKVVGIFHTHPYDRSFSVKDREKGSRTDLVFRDRQLVHYPWLRFFVLTQPEYSNDKYSHEFTHQSDY